MKQIKQLGFQGDIGFLRVDAHIEKAFEKIHGLKIADILKDKKRRIKGALRGDGVLAAGLHPEKGMVLAQGESRQHYHAFRDSKAVELFAVNDNIRLLVLNKPEPLVHEEHDPLSFLDETKVVTEPSVWIQGGQFEYKYDDEMEEYRRVAD